MLSLSATLGAILLFAVVPAGKGTQQHTAQRPVAQLPAARPSPTAPPAAEPNAAEPQAAKAPAAKRECEVFPVESGILAHTNAQRARYGLRPLILDFGLLGSARRHANWMSRNHTMQHTSAAVAENIAMGQNSPQEVVNSWMNSSGHRANMLNSGYSRIGVAAYRSSSGATFWCQQFSR